MDCSTPLGRGNNSYTPQNEKKNHFHETQILLITFLMHKIVSFNYVYTSEFMLFLVVEMLTDGITESLKCM